MGKDLRLDVVSTSSGKGLLETAAEADHAADKIDKLGDQMRQTAVDGGILAAELAATKEQLKSLGKEFDYSGDKTLLKQISTTRRYSGQLEKLRKDLEDVGATAVHEGAKVGQDFGDSVSKGFLSNLGTGGVAGPAIVGALISPGTYGLLAQAGALMGGAVLTGIGLAGIGAGIALSINSNDVQSAIGHLKSDVGAGLTDAASSFVAPMEAAVNDLNSTFHQLQPGIKAVFADIAPELSVLSHGFDGFLSEVVPAFGRAVSAAKPLLDMLGQQLPDLGRSLAYLFDTISKNSGVAEAGLQGIIYVVEDILHVVAGAINMFSSLYRLMLDLEFRVVAFARDIVSVGVEMAKTFHMPHEALDNLLGKLDGLKEGLRKDQAQADLTATAMYGVAVKAGVTASNVDRLATEVQNFNTALRAMDGLLSRAEALNALTIGMAAFKKQLIESKDAFKANTVAGAQNRDSYIALIRQAEQYRKTLIDSGYTQANADKAFQAMVKQIDAAALAAGWSKKQIAALNKELGVTTAMNDINININVKTKYTTQGRPPMSLGHAIPTFASGGRFEPGPIIVGERGPELLVPDGPGRIIPDLKQGGRGGNAAVTGGGTTVVQLVAAPGDLVAEALLSLLRPTVRGRYAGNVTSALAGAN